MANKDGTVDKRYKANTQLPIVKYGLLLMQKDKELEECYMFSDHEAFAKFRNAFESFIINH